MKKRSSKAAKKKTTTVADDCKEYRSSFSEFVCEIESLMKQDREIGSRLQKCLLNRMNQITQIHHIYGRSQNVIESGWFCNLCQTFAGSHQVCGHDYSPLSLEVCCLMAKIARHERDEELKLIGLIPEITPPERLHWNIPVMNKLCGSPTLAGRIEGILIPGLSRFPVFQRMAEQVLAKINGVEGTEMPPFKPSRVIDPKTGILIVRTYAACRPYAMDKKCRCDQCGHPFSLNTKEWDKTPLIVTEEQVSCMRGDDVVKFYHPECFELFSQRAKS